MYSTNIRRLQKAGGEKKKKADQLENSRSKEQYGDEFLGFSFCLINPRLGAEQQCKPKIAISADKKKKSSAKASSF